MGNNRYDDRISEETVKSRWYQAELKKLKKHYGIRATLNSYEQAAWDKEGAYARLDPCNEEWLRIEAAKDIIGANFAMKVHKLLADGRTAEEVIKKLGSFEKHLKSILNPPEVGNLLWGKRIRRALLNEPNWWFEYN